jgi:thiol-disulfide isomerase/thioredoxin
MKFFFAIILTLSSSLFVKAQVAIGEIAPDFSLLNTKNSTVSLSSFRGKVVMIDFWASWCGPCRIANPSVEKIYQKYKSKGFEVIGISIDNKKKAWLKAIAQDKIHYQQLNDTLGWYSPVAEKYGINQIPTSFLLDKEGKIIAIDLIGSRLEMKVKELIKK